MKKLLTILLVAILCIGSVFTLGCNFTESSEPDKPSNSSQVYGVRMAMGAPMTVTVPDGTQYIEKTLTATVLPTTAPNRKVDFIVEWGADATRASEPVSDYIIVVQETDGSATGKVRCLKAFTDDEIIITVKTRDGGLTDTCTVSFVGFCSNIEFDTSALTVGDSVAHGGEHALFKTNTTYTIPILTTNIFNSVTANLEVESGWQGQITGSLVNVYMLGGFTNMVPARPIDGHTNYFSSEIQDDNLVISIKDLELVVGGKLHPFAGDDETSKINEISNNTYFYVKVSDTITGVSQELKFWINSDIDSVTLDNKTMVFNTK